LDANILVDAQVRDFCCRLAEAGQIELRWSAPVLEETRRALADSLRLDPYKIGRLLDALDRAFPDATASGFEPLESQLELPDPDDRHVLAAAIHSECDLLVTSNPKHFSSGELDKHELLVVNVDEAVELLAGWCRESLSEVLNAQIAALRSPPISQEEFLVRLATRAPRGTEAIRAVLGVVGREPGPA